jgi:DNA-binding transcriptional MerR regulator
MFGISTRMLRYYEQIGLLQSLKKAEYAYRVYDKQSIMRLQQIIVLRKLRIPLKQISVMFSNPDAATLTDVFAQSLNEINDEITALSTMRLILDSFIGELRRKSDISLNAMLFSDEAMLDAISSLSLTRINFKEEKSMDELNKASKNLSKLKNVRIVHLSPCTVAASHYIGENPEENAGNQLCEFLKSSNLYKIKPDARVFGFNHPNPSPDKSVYGYEVWVTIPEDMEVPTPLIKKHFDGGLYAAHMIVLGDFHEWDWLAKWVTVDNPTYESNHVDDGGECMGGLLEEHLNYVYYANLNWPDSEENQLDLLFPVKLKSSL